MDTQDLSERLGARLNLPALPRALKRLQALLADPEVSLAEAGARIGEDPALTARLLRTVNSALYGLSADVLLPAHAASIVGLRGLENLMRRVPLRREYAVAGVDVREVWRHSLLTARVCSRMRSETKACPEFDAEELHVFGLLHDLGELALLEGMGADWAALLGEAPGDGARREALERERFGISHGHLGAMLVKRWSLAEDLVRVTRFHHNERGVAEADPLAAFVLVAEAVAEAAVHGAARLQAIPAGSLKLLEVSKDALEELHEYAGGELDEILV